MNFVVTYREKDGSRNKIAIEADDRAGVFPILRERGISAIRVEEGKLPAKNGRSKWSIPNGLKLLLAGCALLSLMAVALTFVFDRPNDTKASKTTTEEPELTQPIEKTSPVDVKITGTNPQGEESNASRQVMAVPHAGAGLYDKDGMRLIGCPCTGCVARISAAVTNISESACKDLGHAKSIEVDPANRFYKSFEGCLYDKNGTILIRCPNVSQMKIPEGVKCIGPHAFEYLKDLANVDIPSSVVEIGECAFYGCMGLESVSIPQGVTNIGRMAFMSCESLKSITIPSNVRMIRRHTFSGCWGLKSAVLMRGVESIGSQAFIDCPQLASVRIPSSVRMIGRNFETEREFLGAMEFGVGYTRPGPGRSMPSVCDELKIVADMGDEDRVHELLYQKTPNMERMRQIYEHRRKIVEERGGRWRTIKVVTEDEWQGGKSPDKAAKKK